MTVLITAISITLCGCFLGIATVGVARESQSQPLLLERAWWRRAHKKAKERLSKVETELCAVEPQTRRRIMQDLHRYEAATSAYLTKYVVMALPTFTASLSTFSFVTQRNSHSAFTPLIATSVALAPIIALLGVSMALSAESRRRATGCYVTNAIVGVIEDYMKLHNEEAEADSSEIPSSYHLHVMPVARGLETVAANLDLFGAKRIRPDGRHPVSELTTHTERAALRVRQVRDKILCGHPDSLESLPHHMKELLTEFVHGRYHMLASDSMAPNQDTMDILTPARRERRGLMIAIAIGCIAPLLLTWAGMPEAVIVTLLGVLAGPGLYVLGIRNRSSIDGSDGTSSSQDDATQSNRNV
ncbi:hypothetical protein [Streptomyces violaceusniger]